MNIPKTFKWSEIPEEDLNNLDLSDKEKFLKQNEINIRQSIGEAVPTIIMQKIAKNIKVILNEIEREADKTGDKRLQPST
jgi:DNA (cytosine-5)-methyltransferase 1